MSRVALAQSLAALSSTVLQQQRRDTGLAALLAIEAASLNRRETGGIDWLVDDAIRQVLSDPYFRNTLPGHEDWVRSVAFSPDGQTLASGSADETVRLWLFLDRLVEIGCQKVRRNLTWAEWQRYLPREPYRQTCPNLPVHPSVPQDQRP